MSKKVWSISTAVRNPHRLRNFLFTLKEMEGRTWDTDAQLEFQARLIKNRFYGFSSTQFYNDLPQNIVKKIEDINYQLTIEEALKIIELKGYEDPAMRGRQSFKPLQKLGFANLKDKKITITSLGEYFLSSDYDLGELFFKSFLKWQYPNPVDRDFSDKSIYDIKPFLATLHLINEVNKLCKEKNQKEKGISKLEFEIFGQSLLNQKDIKEYAKKILEFRKEISNRKTFKDKKLFIEEFKQEFLKDYTNTQNLKDYADNTIRYFRLTRYIYIRGGGYYIDLEPRRKVEIEAMLKEFQVGAEEFSKERYQEYISDITKPKLPWEDEKLLHSIYEELKEDILKKFGITIIPKSSDLKREIASARKLRQRLQDELLKSKFDEIENIDRVIEALKNINSLDMKPSIALEKYITLALTIINDAKAIKPNSLRGDDGEFIFTAAANKPDIECYYESFNSICEVTMLTNRDQWHNEGQPVMRHLRDFEESSFQNENFCIFVAPKLHRDTVNTFWMAIKYEFEGKPQNIIPLNISQIITLLEMVKEMKKSSKSLSHKEFMQFLKEVVELKDSVSNSIEWIENIPKKIEDFKGRVL